MIDCVLTKGITLDKDGYPRIKWNRRMFRLNRLLFTWTNGPIEEGNVIGHLCNNKGCINTKHLYQTTPEQNSTDASRDGLYRTGERHPKARHTKEHVIRMRELYEEGLTQEAIGKLYNITQSRVSEIIRKKTWKDNR